MASSGWQRSKEVFQAALTRAPELRAAFLDEACEGNGELRREVAHLLAAHDAAGDFLSRPIGLDSDGAEEAGGLEAGPQRIGAYQILDTIALGGMGTVYRAMRDDDAFRKTVALKLVRGGRHSDYFGGASARSDRSWRVSSIPTSPPCSTAERPRTASPTW